MYTIYSYWDMAEIKAVLDAVAMLSGGDDFASLLRVFTLIGLFVAVTYGFVRARGEDAAVYLIVIAIWYVGLFVPKVTVTIEDRAPATGAPVAVSNVPLGLAFFASTTSHIGAWLTERYETFFSLPTDLRFDQNGILFGGRILEEMRRSTITDPTLAQDITNFVKNCLNPELLVNPALMNDLINEPDIWSFISSGAGSGMFNPGLAVTVFIPSAAESRWVNCAAVVNGGGTLAAADSLNGRLNAIIAGEQSRLARILNPGRPPVSANALIAGQIEAAESLMLNASRTAAQGIRQNMMINLMRDTSKTIPQLLNDPSAVQIATAESMAAASSNSSYLVMAKVAEGALPKIRNVIHLVVLGVFPILMLLLIMAGTKGGLVLRSYGVTLLWVHLWPPLYAVVNYISTMASAKSTVSALAGIEGQTLGTAATLASTVLSDQAVAGLLSIAVPIMALALVKGGEVAMSGVVSSVMGPAQSAASRAGDSVGQGNIAMGSTSWGTHTANMMAAGKADTNMAYNSGAFSLGRGLGTHRWDAGGAASFDGSAFGSNMGKVGGMLKSALERSSAEQASQSYSMGTDRAFTAARGLQSIGSASRGEETFSGGSHGFGGGESGRISSDITSGMSSITRLAETYAGKHGVNSRLVAQTALAGALAGSAGPGGDWKPFAANANASLTAQGLSAEEASRTVEAARQLTSDKGFSDQAQRVTQAVREGGSRWDSTSGNRYTDSYGAQLADIARAEDQASTSFRRAQAYDQVNREAQSNGSGVEASLAAMYTEKYGTVGAETLARQPTGEQAAVLQDFARGTAEQMAEKFLGGSSAKGITADDKAIQPQVERQTPNVSLADAQDGVLEHRQNQLSNVGGNPSAPPTDNSPLDLRVARTRTENTVSRLQAEAQDSVRGDGQAVVDKYDQGVANSPGNPDEGLTGLVVGKWLDISSGAASLLGLDLPPPPKDNPQAPQMFNSGAPWRNGKSDEDN